KSTKRSTFSSENDNTIPIETHKRKRGRPKSSKKLTAKEMFLQRKHPSNLEPNLEEIEEEDEFSADSSEEESFELLDKKSLENAENSMQISLQNQEPDLWNNPDYRFVAPKKRPRKKYKKRVGLPPEVLERNRLWKDTNANEIREFIALALIMGIVKKPAFDDYWSKDIKQRTPVFSTVMARSRFFKILRYLHISKANPSNRSCAVNKNSRLEKVEYLLNYLKNKWNLYQTPNRYLSIDESMIGFKGKIAFRQYIPRKKHQHGIKCWVMADAHTYYVYEVEIYTGKSDLGTSESELAKKVVLDISQKLAPGHILTFDNFFTGLPLLEELYKRGIGGVGTLRKYRKGLPKSFFDMRLQKKYDMVCLKYKLNPSIKAIVWKDAKLVYCMTNYIPFNEREISKNMKKSKSIIKIRKPEALAEYTQNMNGVDKVDQMASYYSFNRKSFKWWKKVFFYLIEVSISNSYVLYLQNKGEKTMKRKEYRLLLIEKLLSHRRNVQTTPKPLPQRFQHFPHHMDSTRQCYWCKHYYDEKRRTKYYCLKCEVPLCILCFKWYHRHFRIIVERELR
ncbi:MAG: hypothetical protein KC548_06670, partial [Nanoarchaeota archaeon]|nr:hypothetical protein [Nanoarchaeota archaeon]